MDDPEKCTSCHLCEKLCPDFAISVGEKPPRAYGKRFPEQSETAPRHEAHHSPERVAPDVIGDEEDEDE
jgi:2-oxoglutarate ferredoxin oxidoreductase subunit delta